MGQPDAMTPGHWETLRWLAHGRWRTLEPWTVPHWDRIPLLVALGYAQTKCGEGHRSSRYYVTRASWLTVYPVSPGKLRVAADVKIKVGVV